jgi:hypothetical protein
MTEDEWLTCDSPRKLLGFLRGKASERKLRLFAVACCRRRWEAMTDERSRRVVEMAERFVEGLVGEKELALARRAAYAVPWRGVSWVAGQARAAAWNAARPAIWEGTRLIADGSREQVGLLRCLFGNPFRPVTPGPAWLTPTTRALAQAAYDERRLPAGTLDPDRLAVLADALEEAGCTDAEVLGHLRGPGPHTRGCWVVDLVLGNK